MARMARMAMMSLNLKKIERRQKMKK